MKHNHGSQPMICIASLTYRRPEGLSMLLEAFSRLTIPDSVRARILIVDNDPEGSGREIVERYRSQFEHKLDYVIEPGPGIPAGRNRALTEAVDLGADYLCFTDDDAMPDPDWIAKLTCCQSKTEAVVVLGPAVFMRPDGITGLFRRLLARSLVARSHLIAWYVDRASRNGEVYFGATSNLMMDLAWIRLNGIKFHNALAKSGGEDTVFIESIRQLNGAIIWCSKAFVREVLPPDRIKVGYQFSRSRTHGMTLSQVPNRGRLRLLRIPGARLVIGTFFMMFPLLGFASFSLGLHLVGVEVGKIEGWLGRRSRLYAR